MKNDKIKPFYQILQDKAFSLNLTVYGLWKYLNVRGVNISQKMLHKYMYNYSVPSIENAKQILKAISLQDITDKNLSDILELTRIARDANNNHKRISKAIVTGVYLPYNKLSQIIKNEVEIQMELDKRVLATSDSFSDYVCKLIQKDIDEEILEEKERKEE